MFCKKCGYKIIGKEGKCTNCGAVVNTEACGGFWGLTGESPEEGKTDIIRSDPGIGGAPFGNGGGSPMPSGGPMPPGGPMIQPPSQKPPVKKSGIKWERVVMVLSILVAVCAVVWAIHLNNQNKKLKDRWLDDNQQKNSTLSADITTEQTGVTTEYDSTEAGTGEPTDATTGEPTDASTEASIKGNLWGMPAKKDSMTLLSEANALISNRKKTDKEIITRISELHSILVDQDNNGEQVNWNLYNSLKKRARDLGIDIDNENDEE